MNKHPPIHIKMDGQLKRTSLNTSNLEFYFAFAKYYASTFLLSDRKEVFKFHVTFGIRLPTGARSLKNYYFTFCFNRDLKCIQN